eukprot:gene5353-5589_t
MSAGAAAAEAGGIKQKPVLLLDVMDTLVVDPFFVHMPNFFNMSFKELLAAKHPTAWVEFENDCITEDELFVKFFADGRQFDGAALVNHMVDHYRYIEGVQDLLHRLKQAGYAMHAMSNYPKWYLLIEEKLRLSQYLDWTFVSCTGPMKGLRKPAPAAFDCVVNHLQLPAEQLIFVDDRQPNVDAAAAAGMAAIKFNGSCHELERQLRDMGMMF